MSDRFPCGFDGQDRRPFPLATLSAHLVALISMTETNPLGLPRENETLVGLLASRSSSCGKHLPGAPCLLLPAAHRRDASQPAALGDAGVVRGVFLVDSEAQLPSEAPQRWNFR